MPAQSEEKDPTVETAEPGANGEVSSNEEVPASGAAAAGDPVAEAKAEAARMKDQWMRTAADFDNFRKRSRRELEDTRKAGKEDLLKEFLPVFDNLERAIHSASRATEVKAVAEGLQMVLRQYLETLSRGGITKVPGVGSQFDPTYHEAIQQLETDEQPAGTVVAEVQPGYMQGDRLIRAAMVVVAKPKPTGDGASGGEATSSE
ncbi:MAG: nucleotide exchange factor GrpE [Myxococcales bacterium 68-20]|nr:nucleotide exchange factor GrpE [Myxococcales bacterium]OJY22023.1 MAG: nucleotide exchange factor GrpE [Myxococcales bacterium 68-20]